MTTFLVAAVGALVFFAPPQAYAASNPYTPRGVCGSSYYEVQPRKSMSGGFGYVHLLYSSSTKKNCVVVLKAKYIGQATWTDAIIYKSVEDPPTTDQGNFRYYAMTKLYAPGLCVRYGGEVHAGTSANSTPFGEYLSGWVACGKVAAPLTLAGTSRADA